jgi:Ca2+-dependent lipid-binding protein
MADAREHHGDDLDVAVRTAQAALEAALEKRKRAEEEAEEKQRAKEAECKAVPEWECTAKAERVAKEAAEKKKGEVEKAEAERAEKARVAQATYEAGIRVVQANQRNLAEQTARINTQAQATKHHILGSSGSGRTTRYYKLPWGWDRATRKCGESARGWFTSRKRENSGRTMNLSF